MKPVLRLLLLPLQAPWLLVLMVVSTYLGLQWSRPMEAGGSTVSSLATLVWSAQCLHAVVVVIVCTLPHLLLSQMSTLMAANQVITLVITLLLVTIGGIYLLHLDVLSNVLILGSAVLLARLDLVRIRVVPPPLLMAVSMSLVVLSGINLGRWLSSGAG
jgi:hypothetical protein